MRVSLAAVGRWIRSLGQLDPVVAFERGQPLPPRSMDDLEVSQYAIKIKQAQGSNEGTQLKKARRDCERKRRAVSAGLRRRRRNCERERAGVEVECGVGRKRGATRATAGT